MNDTVKGVVEALEKIAAFRYGIPASKKAYDRGYAQGFNNAGGYAHDVAREALAAFRASDTGGALERAAAIKLVREQLTDNIVETATLQPLGKPDVLLAGCKAIGYRNPEIAANEFAGFVVDALSPSSPIPQTAWRDFDQVEAEMTPIHSSPIPEEKIMPSSEICDQSERLSQYIADYEFRGDTDYRPNDHERALIEDALNGWIAEEGALSNPIPTTDLTDADALAVPSWRHFLPSDMDWLADHGHKMGSGVGQQSIERLLVALAHVSPSPIPTTEEGRERADHVYDFDDWSLTYEASDIAELEEGWLEGAQVGTIFTLGRLKSLPNQYGVVAYVGSEDEAKEEVLYFATLEKAQAFRDVTLAASPQPHEGEGS